MTKLVDRMFEIAMQSFKTGYVPQTFLVSGDVLVSIEKLSVFGYPSKPSEPVPGADLRPYVWGIPVVVDDALPPDSVVVRETNG